MKSQTVNLILRQFSIAAAILLVAGCSFKKDPDKNRSAVITIEDMAKEDAQPSLEKIISQGTEEEALKLLSNQKMIAINDIKTSDGSLLDTAVRLKRLSIIQYLTIVGHSPFALSEVSYSSINSDEKLNRLILEIQEDHFHDLIRFYPKLKSEINDYTGDSYTEVRGSMSEFRQRISESRLGKRGCLNFADFLVSIKYRNEQHNFPGLYYETIHNIDVVSAIKDVLTLTECSAYTHEYPSNKIAQWIADEILIQFYNNFESHDFIDFLEALNKPSKITINLINNLDKKVIKKETVNPLSLLILKRECAKNFDFWFKKIKAYSQYSQNDYSIPYYLPGDLNSCPSTDATYCVDAFENQKGLHTVQRLLISNEPDAEYKILNEKIRCSGDNIAEQSEDSEVGNE